MWLVGATPPATQAGNVQLIHLPASSEASSSPAAAAGLSNPAGPHPEGPLSRGLQVCHKGFGGCCPTALPTPKQSGHSERLPSVPGQPAKARSDQGREGLHVWSPRPSSAEGGLEVGPSCGLRGKPSPFPHDRRGPAPDVCGTRPSASVKWARAAPVASIKARGACPEPRRRPLKTHSKNPFPPRR